MIPTFIAKLHIAEAIQRIIRKGVPPPRRGRRYCLVTSGAHLPPKYTIALAHQVATGERLSSDQFSGGPESNEFLRRRGFDVAECDCGGSVHDNRVASVSGPSVRRKRTTASSRHSERCADCKVQVASFLERIYGTCVPNHRFHWQAALAPYPATSIGSVLREVDQRLEAHRGFGVGKFVRSDVLAGCDYWVPNPGFIVEFDESQHFTIPRKLALSVYADIDSLGFSAKRWMELCEHHNARDNNPPDRDEQRAWYDTLRDLIPSIMGWQPTVRLYARDLVWCSLDPDSREDRERFLDLLHGERSPSSRTTMEMRSAPVQPESTLRLAMVFPQIAKRSSDGVPLTGALVPPGEDQKPNLPSAASFAGEALDFLLFPENYISASDQERAESLKRLASDLGAPLLVGATDRSVDPTGRAWQVLLRFDPDGSRSRVYTKHSSANAVAFGLPDWEPSSRLPTFELGGVTTGATICHDHYLGLLPRFLARRGARLWINPSFDNVSDIKWSSVLRLRAVENRFFAICTLHDDENMPNSTHPFAFAPDGTELEARLAGSHTKRPMSECREAGQIYMVDLDMAAVDKQLDWSKLPPAKEPKRPRNGEPRKPIRIGLRDGQPAVVGRSGRYTIDLASPVETVHGPVYVGVVPGEQILDAAECFRVIDDARQMDCAPIIWNHWERLPTDSFRLATLMMGRAIECCAPIVISDRDGIHELVELTNYKVPVRRAITDRTSAAPVHRHKGRYMGSSRAAIVDIGYARGRDIAFNMVTKYLPAGKHKIALDRYRSLV